MDTQQEEMKVILKRYATSDSLADRVVANSILLALFATPEDQFWDVLCDITKGIEQTLNNLSKDWAAVVDD